MMQLRGRGSNLGYAVMVMGVMVMMTRSGEGRAGENHHQQDSSKNLFHGSNRSTIPAPMLAEQPARTKRENRRQRHFRSRTPVRKRA